MSGSDEGLSFKTASSECIDRLDETTRSTAAPTLSSKHNEDGQKNGVINDTSEIVPTYSNGTVFYNRTTSSSKPVTERRDNSIHSIQEQLATTHIHSHSSKGVPVLNRPIRQQHPTMHGPPGMYAKPGIPQIQPFKDHNIFHPTSQYTNTFHKTNSNGRSKSVRELPVHASSAYIDPIYAAQTAVNGSNVDGKQIAPVSHESSVGIEQAASTKSHNWSGLLEVGTTNGFFCTQCHRIQRRGHEWGSRKRQGLEPIDACVSGTHQFIPFYRGSNIMRCCRDCGVTQRWGKKFGSNKSAGFEPLAKELCINSDPEAMAYYYKILVDASEYVTPMTPVLRPDSVDANVANNLWDSVADRLSQEQVHDQDFQTEFPIFSGVKRELIIEALTHPSHTGADGKNYLRLAFLGDAVLDMFVAERLYTVKQHMNNGEMTVEKSRIVANQSIGLYATQYLPHVRTKLVITRESKIAGDVIEALIGAYYLQFGYTKTTKFLDQLGVARMSKET